MSHKPKLLQERERILRALVATAEDVLPGTGIMILASDWGEDGMLSYASNVRRDDAIKLLEEHIARLRERTDNTATTFEA